MILVDLNSFFRGTHNIFMSQPVMDLLLLLTFGRLLAMESLLKLEMRLTFKGCWHLKGDIWKVTFESWQLKGDLKSI